MIIDHVGGRKNVLGYVFLLCCTFLVYLESHKTPSDYLGLCAVIGAIATGVGALVWGNVQEHMANSNKPEQSQ